MTIPVAVQLWTLRDECPKDFFGTLERVADAGYEWIEPYEFYGADIAALAEHLKKIGLGVISSHVSLGRLEGELPRVIEEHKALGCADIVCPWLDEDRRAGEGAYEKIGDILNGVGEKLAAEGMRLAYHNHEFEFTTGRPPDGVFRILTRAKKKHLSAQLDVYWLSHAHVDPIRYMERLAGRLHSLHLKDGDPLKQTFSSVGEGKVEMPAIIAAGAAAGVRAFVVEQDECGGAPFEAIARSRAYLKSQGH